MPECSFEGAREPLLLITFLALRVVLCLLSFFDSLSGLIKSADESNKFATLALLMPPLYLRYPIEFGVKYVLKTCL